MNKNVVFLGWIRAGRGLYGLIGFSSLGCCFYRKNACSGFKTTPYSAVCTQRLRCWIYLGAIFVFKLSFTFFVFLLLSHYYYTLVALSTNTVTCCISIPIHEYACNYTPMYSCITGAVSQPCPLLAATEPHPVPQIVLQFVMLTQFTDEHTGLFSSLFWNARNSPAIP